MNRNQKTILIIYCTLLALLFVVLFVAAGVSVAKNGLQGLIGEMLGNDLPAESVTELPTVEVLETVSREQSTQSEEDLIDMLFDRGGKMHKPSYEDYLKVRERMTVVEIVEILGKPHGWDAGAGQRYFGWSLDNGDTVWIQLTIPNGEGPDWDGLFTENYGGAVALSIRYSGSESNEFGK